MAVYRGDYFDLDEILATEPVSLTTLLSISLFNDTIPLKEASIQIIDSPNLSVLLVALCLFQRVYATFNVRGHRLAYLDPQRDTHVGPSPPHNNNPTNSNNDPSQTRQDVPAETRLALPFWLAETLAERSIVRLDLPRCYGTRLRNDLRADAVHVNLYAACAWWLRLGREMVGLLVDGSLGTVLANAYGERCWDVVDRAENGVGMMGIGTGGYRGGGIIDGLCEVERDLFFEAYDSWFRFKKWRERGGDKIRAAPRVLGKRRLMAERAMSVRQDDNESDGEMQNHRRRKRQVGPCAT